MNHYYLQRARTAYKAAEAADDPRDAAAYKAAARTWEQLAKPRTEPTFTMEPYRQQLAALKHDVVEAIDAPYAGKTFVGTYDMMTGKAVRTELVPTAIEF